MPFILYDNVITKGRGSVSTTNVTNAERLLTPQLSPKAFLQASSDCVFDISPGQTDQDHIGFNAFALLGVRFESLAFSPPYNKGNIEAPMLVEYRARTFAPYDVLDPSLYEVIRVGRTPFNDEHIIIKFHAFFQAINRLRITISTPSDGDDISIGSIFFGAFMESSELIERVSAINYRSTATKETSSGGQIYTSEGSLTRTVRVQQSALPYWQMNGGFPNPKTLTPLGAPDVVDAGITDAGDYWHGSGTIRWNNALAADTFFKFNYRAVTTGAAGASSLDVGGDFESMIGTASILRDERTAVTDFDFELDEAGTQELRVYKDFKIEYYKTTDTDEQNKIKQFLNGGVSRMFAKVGTNQPVLIVMASEPYMRQQTAFYGFIERINEYKYSQNTVSGSFDLAETL